MHHRPLPTYQHVLIFPRAAKTTVILKITTNGACGKLSTTESVHESTFNKLFEMSTIPYLLYFQGNYFTQLIAQCLAF